jgi:hypothetical protein
MSSFAPDYLERRRQECLASAERATNPAIAEVHRKFAAEYGRKLAADKLDPLRDFSRS